MNSNVPSAFKGAENRTGLPSQQSVTRSATVTGNPLIPSVTVPETRTSDEVEAMFFATRISIFTVPSCIFAFSSKDPGSPEPHGFDLVLFRKDAQIAIFAVFMKAIAKVPLAVIGRMVEATMFAVHRRHNRIFKIFGFATGLPVFHQMCVTGDTRDWKNEFQRNYRLPRYNDV